MKLPDFKKMSKREKTAVGIATVALLLWGSYYAVLSPWLNYRAKLKKEIRLLERETQGGNLLLSRQISILRDRAAYEKFVHKSGRAETDIAAFLKEIESLAAQSQVSLQEIRPLNTESSEWFQEYGLEVNYATTLPEWMHFVYLIESSPSLLTIERATIGTENDKADALKGSMRIKKLVVFDEPVVPAAG